MMHETGCQFGKQGNQDQVLLDCDAVSGDLVASIFRVKGRANFTLNMEAKRSPETSVAYRNTSRRHNSEDIDLNFHRSKKFEFFIKIIQLREEPLDPFGVWCELSFNCVVFYCVFLRVLLTV